MGSFVVSALEGAGGYAISRQNNLELHLGCHSCTHVKCVILHWYAWGADERSVARAVYGYVITKFLGWIDFLSYGVPPTRTNGYVFFIILLTSGRNRPLLVSGNSSGKKSNLTPVFNIHGERSRGK